MCSELDKANRLYRYVASSLVTDLLSGERHYKELYFCVLNVVFGESDVPSPNWLEGDTFHICPFICMKFCVIFITTSYLLHTWMDFIVCACICV